MNVCHHLDEATVIRYASGDLDEAFSVVVASHVAMCRECRRAVAAAEEVGGNLLDTCGSVGLSATAFERFSSSVEGREGPGAMEQAALSGKTGLREHVADAGGDVPMPLRRFVGSKIDEITWKTVVPGVAKRTIQLGSKTSSKLYMLRIAPGIAVPEHGHGGDEMTLILKGAYDDALGRFGPGDIADLDAEVEHQPTVVSGEPCICLVASETPTLFKSIVGRIMQPFVGI